MKPGNTTIVVAIIGLQITVGILQICAAVKAAFRGEGDWCVSAAVCSFFAFQSAYLWRRLALP